jgi:hypothetical protein
MDGYRTGQAEEDAPRAERISHGGAMGESHEARERSRRIAETVEHLREAAYHVNEAGEGLAWLGLDALAIHKASGKNGMPMFDLSDALAAIREADKAVAPKRGEERA